MAVGILQIYNLMQISQRLDALSRKSTNLDRSSMNLEIKRSQDRARYILFSLLLFIGAIFIADTSLVYPSIKSNPTSS